MAPDQQGAPVTEPIQRRTDGRFDAKGRQGEPDWGCQEAQLQPIHHASRKHFDQMEIADAKRLKPLEGKNGRLKELLAERDPDIEVLKEITAKMW